MTVTEGPWEVGKAYEHGRFVITVLKKNGKRTYLLPTASNINMIAAAPEMLEALENMMSAMPCRGAHDCETPLHNAMRKAIGKAKGETNEKRND